MKRLAIFDLDDTLIDTSHIYWESRTAFLDCISESGFNRKEVLDSFEEVDGRHIIKYGHAPERYGMSMVVTYNDLCSRHDCPRDEDLLQRIRSAGRIVQEKVPDLIPGALELLDGTRALGMTLALVTRGSEFTQREKIVRHDLNRYFDRIEIVQTKNAGLFKRVISECGFLEDECWIIGDSVRSDINPGIEAGAKCILYLYTHNFYYWQQEYGAAPKGKFYIAEELRDILPILCNPDSADQVHIVPRRPDDLPI